LGHNQGKEERRDQNRNLVHSNIPAQPVSGARGGGVSARKRAAACRARKLPPHNLPAGHLLYAVALHCNVQQARDERAKLRLVLVHADASLVVEIREAGIEGKRVGHET